MSEGFRGFAKPAQDKELKLYIKNREVDKLIKEYKKLKKYQKSSIFEIEKFCLARQCSYKQKNFIHSNPQSL
jgi:hypothetical protein